MYDLLAELCQELTRIVKLYGSVVSCPIPLFSCLFPCFAQLHGNHWIFIVMGFYFSDQVKGTSLVLDGDNVPTDGITSLLSSSSHDLEM